MTWPDDGHRAGVDGLRAARRSMMVTLGNARPCVPLRTVPAWCVRVYRSVLMAPHKA